jgi:hypothetical protein
VQASRLLAVSAAHAAALDRLKATRHRQQQAEAERLAAKMEAKQAKIDEAAERRGARHMSQAQRLRLRRWLRFCAFVSRSYAMQQTFEKALTVGRVRMRSAARAQRATARGRAAGMRAVPVPVPVREPHSVSPGGAAREGGDAAC